MNTKAIVRLYILKIRPRAQAEIDWFARQPTFSAATRNAALAVNSHGKRYSHQRRLTKAALEKVLNVLSKRAPALEQARDFAELLALIGAAVEPIRGLGELYVYDTAFRIGSRLNLFPERVYLHAGTRRGARALGLNARTEVLEIKDLPSEFQVLKPYEIEDVLCIFKDEFATPRHTAVPANAARRSRCG